MNEKELVFWLKGYLDACTIEGKVKLTQEQVEEITNKINHVIPNVKNNMTGYWYNNPNINWGGTVMDNFKKY
jgi:hypothetical protein